MHQRHGEPAEHLCNQTMIYFPRKYPYQLAPAPPCTLESWDIRIPRDCYSNRFSRNNNQLEWGVCLKQKRKDIFLEMPSHQEPCYYCSCKSTTYEKRHAHMTNTSRKGDNHWNFGTGHQIWKIGVRTWHFRHFFANEMWKVSTSDTLLPINNPPRKWVKH